LLAAVLPVIAALLVHAAALDHPFVYDDHDTVVTNPSLAPPMNPRFVLAHSPFRPVVNVSYAIDRAIWGYRPFGFHLTNLLLHAAVVALLFVLIFKALRDARMQSGDGAHASDPSQSLDPWIACFAAMAFAVHPLMTEAAGYVSGRSELLCAVFFLAALLCARSAMLSFNPNAHPNPPRGGVWLSTTGAAVFGVLAFLSKEVAVALPVVLLAYDWVVLPSPTHVRLRRLLGLFVPLGLLTVAVAVSRLAAFRGDALAAPHLNLLTQFIVIWRYLGLVVAPIGQSIMHGVRYVTTAADPIALLAAAGLVLLCVATYKTRRIAPPAALGIIWFLAAISPSSSIVSLREGMAEHRVYLASAGVFVCLAAIVKWYFSRSSGRPSVGAVHVLVAAGIIGTLSVLTLARHRMWHDPVLLWAEAAATAPDMWEPHYALADALRESGQCSDAVPEYEAVIRLRPSHRDANTNLGICLAQVGRLAEAESAFRRALEIDPQFARGFTNLGALAITAADFERAREMYLEAIHVDPKNVLARMQLARLYEEVFRDYHAAARMCGEARALQPFTAGVIECVERNQKLAVARDTGR
jgi:hypothetical protein